MGRIIRAQRKGRSKGVFKISSKNKKGASKFHPFIEKEHLKGLSGVVSDIMHEPGRGAPMMEIEFDVKFGEKKRKIVIAAIDGVYVGKRIYCGKKASLDIGNILSIGDIPEGATVCHIEKEVGDQGKLARASGNHAIIIGHDLEEKKTRIKLPSGMKKSIQSECRAMIGMIAGGSRIDKPLLKAGRAFYKYKNKATVWPRVRGVAMNPVDHPHGGGNHQHVGHPTTVSRHAPPGQKVGLIAARRTGLIRGKKKKKFE